MNKGFNLNFNAGNLIAGTIITDQFTGVNIYSSSEFGVMLFDTNNITGEDFDLAATDLGNVLIISEDGDSNDPDDKATGGTISIEFAQLAEVTSIGLLDIDEEGSFLDFFDQDAQLIKTVAISHLDDNSFQELNLNITDVARMDINLAASGAVTGLSFMMSCYDANNSNEFRTITGEGNNLEHPQLGSSATELIRLFDLFYEDGFNSPRVTSSTGNILPNPRTISNTVVAQAELVTNYLNATDWLWQWGQFIDHDLTLNEGGPSSPPEDFIPIPVPQEDSNDPFVQNGITELPFIRSAAEETGTDLSNPRQQTNQLTHFIDASSVYGSTTEVAQALRDPDGGGRLLTQIKLVNNDREELLPFQSQTPVPAANPLGLSPNETFVAGDVRVNEQIGLTAVHTLFVREHNRIAREIEARLAAGDVEIVDRFNQSELSEDDFIYESTRMVIAAQIQLITYNEFLPLLVGPQFHPVDNVLGDGFGIAPFTGYRPEINPSVSSEFANAAYRLGHTLLSPEIQRFDQNGFNGTFLEEAFFNTNQIYDPDKDEGLGVDSIYAGLALQGAQEFDNQIVDGMRNFLFNEIRGGLDLASVNIARGREVGLPTLNEARQLLGLAPHSSFGEISSTPGVADRLALVYESVDDVDLWVGGISEDTVNGGLLGETFNLIVSDQFQRSRDGDRFFYLNKLDQIKVFAPDIENTTLSGVIRDNTAQDFMIQDNAFILPFENQVTGTDLDETVQGSNQADLIEGLGGNDRLVGNYGADIFLGGDGNDTIQGGNGDDDLYGGTGDDELTGGNGADQLLGGDGDDILHGAEGNDLLVGGTGADSFLFGGEGLALEDLGSDRIEGFQVAEDLILLSEASFTNLEGSISLTIVDELSTGDLSTADLIYNQATGLLLYNANGEPRLEDSRILAQLDIGLELSEANFVIA